MSTAKCPNSNYISSFKVIGYLWLPYDLSEKIKLFGVRFKQKNTLCHSFRIIVMPSVLLSFLPNYCHSFRIIVIPSVLLSFFPKYCHSFRIFVILSELLSFQRFVIQNSFFTLPYPKGEKIGWQSRPYLRV
jgi:hypothetical protein